MKWLVSGFIVLYSIILNGQEFHVSKTGNDGNSGTSSLPWESIQHAMDNATPGSTVYIHEGIYFEALYVNVSGSNNKYITFSGFENDEVIVDAVGQISTAIVEIYDAHHIALENLIIRNHQQNNAVGILVGGACDHIRIEDCEVYDINFSSNPNAAVNQNTNAHAIAVYADNSDHAITDLQIYHNKIHDCRLGFSEALAVNGNVDGFEIMDNEIYNVTNIGIDIIGHEGTCDDPTKDQARNGYIAKNVTYNCLSPYATSAGIYVDGGKNLIIEKNRVFQNQWGIEIGCENTGKSTDNIIVRNNLIYGNATSGLAVGGYDYPSGSGKVTNVTIINNTLFGNDTENAYSGEIYLFYNESLEIVNNIIFGTSPTAYLLSTEDIAPSIGLKFHNNNWVTAIGLGQEEFYFYGNDYKGISEFQNAVNGVGNISGDPEFKSINTQYDFRVNAGSLCIDAGTNSTKSGDEDYYENDRVVGSSIDIGAYEYNQALSTEAEEKLIISIYPNPTSETVTIKTNLNDEIQIFDALGKLKSTNIVDYKKVIINLQEWEPGIYYILLSSGESHSIIKI